MTSPMPVDASTDTLTQIAEPYKGMESYRQEDADIFFGRDAEGQLLAATIAGSPFTVLHAQSGAGKTSLLNARVIPNLEAGGLMPILVRLQNDPVESVRTAVLLNLFPSPKVERSAILALIKSKLVEDTKATVGEALKAFDLLPTWDLRRTALVAPVTCDYAIPGSSTKGIGPALPIFARLLRSTMELSRYAAHLAAIGSGDQGVFRDALAITTHTPLQFLLDILNDPAFEASYRQQLGNSYLPQPELRLFFEHLFATYGVLIPKFAIALIFDQFEELFTLFAPALTSSPEAAAPRSRWKLQSEFLVQLQDLYRAATPDDAPWSDGNKPEANSLLLQTVLPLKIVLSMRDEYIAQLGPLKAFVPGLSNCYYHLTLLNRQQAQEAITKPAGEFNYRYSAECLKEIIEDLTKEDGLIEPAHLQLVCHKLWKAEGNQLARERLANPSEEATQAAGHSREQTSSNLPEISVDVFNHLKRVRGILSSHLGGFLDAMPKDRQLKSLEILEQLVTMGRTRNIVEKDVLTRVPYGNPGEREVLIQKMVDAKILRVEPRLGGNFVEIVHEFLIDGVLQEIRTRLLGDAEHTRLRIALKDLATTSMSRVHAVVDRQNFEILDKQWDSDLGDQQAIEIMARSAIEYGLGRGVCAKWLGKVKGIDRDAARSRELVESWCVQRDILAVAEMQVAQSLAEAALLSERARLVVLRSHLMWSSQATTSEIRLWIRKAGLNA